MTVDLPDANEQDMEECGEALSKIKWVPLHIFNHHWVVYYANMSISRFCYENNIQNVFVLFRPLKHKRAEGWGPGGGGY